MSYVSEAVCKCVRPDTGHVSCAACGGVLPSGFRDPRDVRIEVLENRWKRLSEELATRLTHYGEDIFVEPPAGKHGVTVDGCSARAHRALLHSLMRAMRLIEAEGPQLPELVANTCARCLHHRCAHTEGTAGGCSRVGCWCGCWVPHPAERGAAT